MRIALLLALAIGALAGIATADEVAPDASTFLVAAAGPAPGAVGVSPEASAAALAEADAITSALDAVAHRDWGLVASAVLLALMWLLRTYGGALVEKLRIDTHVGGVLTNFALAFFGMLATALKLHQPVDLHLVIVALTTSLAAAGGWHAIAKPIVAWWQARKTVLDAAELRKVALAKALDELPAGASAEAQAAAVARVLGGGVA